MREVGCDCISFGIESGNPEMLKRIRKGITLEQARNAVKCCKDADILPHASFMVGLPGESIETLQQTQRFALELDIAFGYHFFSPFPGTTVREEIENYDIEILTNDWNRYDANSPIVKTSRLSPEEMAAFVAEYDRTNDEIWEDMEQHHKDGTCTDREYLLIEGNRKLKLVYRILSEDLVEESPCRNTEGSHPIELLADSVAKKTGTDRSFTSRVLTGYFEAGYIKAFLMNGSYRYYWTHNKETDILPIAF
jgi:anaerobic magnesium-protoporphyrin IX monomethyl ester cyclase